MVKSYGGTFVSYRVFNGTREVAKWAMRTYIEECICYFESWAEFLLTQKLLRHGKEGASSYACKREASDRSE